MNSFQLKWIAVLTMAIDHTGAVLFPENVVLRCIGRIAFPIFCFLLVEGVFYTRNVYKYMGRLALFALLSEVPFDLALYGVPLELRHQNVFFTLLCGVAMICFLERYRDWYIRGLVIVAFVWAAEAMMSDYGSSGILLILIYYVSRDCRKAGIAAGVGWNLLLFRGIQRWGAAASVPIALYNGKKGTGMKYFFYVFYPAHLLLLYVIKKCLG